MSRARRSIAAAGSIVCLLVLAAGCSFGSSAKTPKSFAPRPKTGLASYLEAPPEGSRPGTSSWAKSYEPSTSAFLDHFYNPTVHSAVRKSLAAQGLVDIAHTLWITSDLVEGDLVLMKFSGPDGPTSRLNSVQDGLRADTSLNKYTIDGLGAPVVYYTKSLDEHNNIEAKAYAVWDDFFLELFTFSPVEVEKVYIERWLEAQIRLLPTG